MPNNKINFEVGGLYLNDGFAKNLYMKESSIMRRDRHWVDIKEKLMPGQPFLVLEVKYDFSRESSNIHYYILKILRNETVCWVEFLI